MTQEVTIEDVDKMVEPSNKWEEPLMIELEEFTESIIEDRDPLVTGEDGLRALEICEAAIESAYAKQVIKMYGVV